MTTRTTRFRTISSTLVSLLLLLAVPAMCAAQASDHLECFKIKDSAKFDATADLVPLDDPPFPVATGCRIKVRATKFCTPVEKQLQESSAPAVEFPTQALENGFLCYKMKCPKFASTDTAVTDQFGTRPVSKFVAREICAPAVVGDPPPFTCSDQNQLTCAQGSCPAGQACALNTSTLACECQAGGGTTTTTTITLPIGGGCDTQTPATCSLGTCPGAQTCSLNTTSLACECTP
jgi:hypothetical protein